jgi:methyl-accepting chemotaxis protein
MANQSTSFFGSIRGRLIGGTAALALIPLILIALALGWYASRESAAALDARANDQMASLRAGKQEEVLAYFENVRDLLGTIANTAEVRQALRDTAATQSQMNLASLGVDEAGARAALVDYYGKQFGAQYSARNPGRRADLSSIVATLPPQTLAAQYAYIAGNPNPLGKKGDLDKANDGSAYSEAHARVHAYARRVVQEYGLYDFFLVDADSGFVTYTYFKELDYATDLRKGPWAETGLGKAFALARSAKRPDEVLITDYAPYRPSYDDQASFVSTPIVENGRTIGVLVVQLPIDRVNQIMTFGGRWKEVGLGETGEIYLVGPDKTPRSISRFMQQDSAGFIGMMRGQKVPQETLAAMDSRDSNIGLMSIDTRGVQEALAGRTGTAVYADYRGEQVLGSYAPIDVLGLRWAMLSEIDAAEAGAPVAALQRGILIAAAASLLVVGLIAVFAGLLLARSINRPLSRLQETVRKVGAGDLAARTGTTTSDEIGQLATAFDTLLDEKVAELARAQKENDQLNNSVIEIMTSVAQLAQRDLNVKVPVAEDVTGAVSDAINMMTRSTATALGRVNQISASVSNASGQVKSRAQKVLQLAQDSGRQAQSTSTDLGSAAEALTEIARQARSAESDAERAIQATAVALERVRETVSGISESRERIEETEARMKRLSEISGRIGTAVNLIEEIADRTSVLALTASMQAISAGEAGRGFAVVADEVKRLAESAHNSARQIAEMATVIQNETATTLQSLDATVTKVNEISHVADQAGEQMNATRQTTAALANSVRSIASVTGAQSETSKRLLERADRLAEASRRTVSEIQQQSHDAEALDGSASALVETVSEFRLPPH